jgi:hypothetical protein
MKFYHSLEMLTSFILVREREIKLNVKQNRRTYKYTVLKYVPSKDGRIKSNILMLKEKVDIVLTVT